MMANDLSLDPMIRQLIGFHTLGTKYSPDTTAIESLPLFAKVDPDQPVPPDEEVVEDAGLFDHERTIESETLATDLTMR